MLFFSRKEAAVLLFLLSSFAVGTGIWIYRAQWASSSELSQMETGRSVELSDSAEVILKERISIQKNETAVVFLNRANQEELERLPGIGPVMAKRILEFRSRKGKVESIDELLQITVFTTILSVSLAVVQQSSAQNPNLSFPGLFCHKSPVRPFLGRFFCSIPATLS